jgi:hypothetical protein
MELEEFISKTLVNISKGVKSANKEVGGLFMIEPSSWYKDRTDGAIKFDIAVTASNESGQSGSGGIKVWSVGIGAEKQSSKLDETVTKIKFSVAINTAIS